MVEVSISFTMGNAHRHNDLPAVPAIATHLDKDERTI